MSFHLQIQIELNQFWKQSDKVMDITWKVRPKWAIFLESPWFWFYQSDMYFSFAIEFVLQFVERERDLRVHVPGPTLYIGSLSLHAKGRYQMGMFSLFLIQLALAFALLTPKKGEKKEEKGQCHFCFLVNKSEQILRKVSLFVSNGHLYLNDVLLRMGPRTDTKLTCP